MKYLRSQLTENALWTDICGTFAICVAYVFLKAFVVIRSKGSDVRLQHCNASDGCVTYRVLAAH